jgi:hypothetical protein
MDPTSGEVGVMRLPPGFDPRRVVAATPDLEAHTGGMPGEQEPAPGALGGLPLQEMPGGDMERAESAGQPGGGAGMPSGGMTAGAPGGEFGGMTGQPPGGEMPPGGMTGQTPGGDMPIGAMTGQAPGGDMPIGAMTGPESGAKLPESGAAAMPGEAGAATADATGELGGAMREARPGAWTSGSGAGVGLGPMNGGGAGSGPAGFGQGMPVGMDAGDPTEGLAEGMPVGAMEAAPDTVAAKEAEAAPAHGDGVTLEGRWRLTFSTITAGRTGD